MVTQFNSTLSWLDSSESERRAVMELGCVDISP